jgi:hypothetical protein
LCGTGQILRACAANFPRIMAMPENVTTLLLIVRAEIRSLEQDAADLPPLAAAPLLAHVERLSTRSRRLAHTAAMRLRSH